MQKNKSITFGCKAILLDTRWTTNFKYKSTNIHLSVSPSSLVSHQTVQLGHGALASRLADVPHLDAALSSSVDVARRGADGDGAHHLSVVQGVYLTGMAWDSRAQQGVRGKGHRLHLAVCAHVERVGAGEKIEGRE